MKKPVSEPKKISTNNSEDKEKKKKKNGRPITYRNNIDIHII